MRPLSSSFSRKLSLVATATSTRCTKFHLNQQQQQQQQQQGRTLFTSRLKNVIRTIVAGDDHVNPKKILERRYLYYALLALRFRSLRLIQQQQQHEPSSSFSFEAEVKVDNDSLYEQAIQELDARQLDRMRNTQLRQELQLALQPQVIDIFQAFQQVDNTLGIDQIGRRQQQQEEDGDDDDDDEGIERRVDPFHGVDWEAYKSILFDEYSKTCSDLELRRKKETNVVPRAVSFLEQKRDGIETLLRFHDMGTDSVNGRNAPSSRDEDDDVFGVNLQDTPGRSLDLIRRYQTINLARSALIRDKLGYSVICLQSTIPGAGRGLFVDGQAMAGSLLAFIPGEIWPKEHLLTKTVDVMEHFNDNTNDDDGEDDDCQITLRFDDFVVDSRQSPVTVLSREGSLNPWALGHMINHPPTATLPNCQSTMLNYTKQMDLGRLVKYVPHTYARQPGWQSHLFDAEPTLMHGMGILARRDVCHEELVYDYRIQSDETPEWYSVVEYGDKGNMMDKEQVVFFRNDWMEK